MRGNNAYDGPLLYLINSNQTNLINSGNITKNGLYTSDMYTPNNFIAEKMRLSTVADPGLNATYDPFPVKYDDTFVNLISAYTAKQLSNPKFISVIVVTKSNLTFQSMTDIYLQSALLTA